MPVELLKDQEGNVAHITLSGTLNKADYEVFGPALGSFIAERGKVRLLLEMRDFHGWSVAALWEDVKFDLKHFNEIERIAMVGDKAWQKGMSVFCRPFTTAKIRYFETAEMEQAEAWVRSPVDD